MDTFGGTVPDLKDGRCDVSEYVLLSSTFSVHGGPSIFIGPKRLLIHLGCSRTFFVQNCVN